MTKLVGRVTIERSTTVFIDRHSYLLINRPKIFRYLLPNFWSGQFRVIIPLMFARVPADQANVCQRLS